MFSSLSAIAKTRLSLSDRHQNLAIFVIDISTNVGY